MYKDVFKSEYGYYVLQDKPSEEKLEKYYEEKYYQLGKGTHKEKYSEEEIEFIFNRLERKYEIVDKFLYTKDKRFLDIGCGEGWALKFFKRKGLNVTGIDYSSHGISSINPELNKYLTAGNILAIINDWIQSKKSYDIILLDNVLEHLLDPVLVTKKLKKLLKPDGICIIEVPNDFSSLQEYLYQNDKINSPFWVTSPDHISYFNKEGLTNLFVQNGFKRVHLSTDYPIDIHLLNRDTNYNLNKDKGKNVHYARVEFENFLHELDLDKTNKLYEILADIGIGRNLIAYFKHNGK
jgi:2-polyprenyl-3-methyl-5-hydroxy-6-metoxy-1,4-benzoquinol methylase